MINCRHIEITPQISEQVTRFLHGAFDLETKRIRLLPASFYNQFDQIVLQIVGNRSARYVFPTIELVDFLKQHIGSRTAIEIGSGNADLYYHLGIRGTDSCIQKSDAMVSAYYAMTGQPITNPPDDVLALEANQAVEQLKPQVVIGSWVTQKIDQDDPCGSGSMFGVDHELLVSKTEQFIMIGNDAVHGHSRIMSRPHQTISVPWLKSRASQPQLDRIYIWN